MIRFRGNKSYLQASVRREFFLYIGPCRNFHIIGRKTIWIRRRSVSRKSTIRAWWIWTLQLVLHLPVSSSKLAICVQGISKMSQATMMHARKLLFYLLGKNRQKRTLVSITVRLLLRKKSTIWTRRELNPRPFAVAAKMRSEHHTPRPHALNIPGEILRTTMYARQNTAVRLPWITSSGNTSHQIQ